jgi:hypothetical protein
VEHGRVTRDEGALATYARNHPDAAKFIRTLIKNQDVRHVVSGQGDAVEDRLSNVGSLRVAYIAEGELARDSKSCDRRLRPQ